MTGRRKQPLPSPNSSPRPKRSRRPTHKARSQVADEEPPSRPSPPLVSASQAPDAVEPLPQQSGETSQAAPASDPLLAAILDEVRRQGQAIQVIQTQLNNGTGPTPVAPQSGPAVQPSAATTSATVQPTPVVPETQPGPRPHPVAQTSTAGTQGGAEEAIEPKGSGGAEEATEPNGSGVTLPGVRVQLQPDPRPIITAGMPLGHLLPAKIKQDIWADKFVDMAALLYPDTHTSYGVQFAGDLASEEGHGEIRFAPRKRRITAITDWSKAFSTYIAVYIQKPGREASAPELLTYMAEIQSIAEDGLDWALYDDQYRRDRAANINPPPWSAVNQPLHNIILRKRTSAMPPSQAQKKPSNSNFRSQSNTANNRPPNPYNIPPGSCYSYHTPNRRCTKQNCSYKHQCFHCKHHQNHPAFLCRQKSHRQQHQNSFRQRPFANTYRY